MSTLSNNLITNTMFSHGSMYITTTLPYVNSSPHIGHAFEFVIADFLKRYYDLLGTSNNGENNRVVFSCPIDVKRECFLNTGIDEHGQKVAQKSIELNKDTQLYCDEMAEEWKLFCSALNMNYSNFYRTTSNKHKKLSQDFLYSIRELIYEKEYSGKYCSGCESFKTEKEIKNNQCEYHPGLELKIISETNFFFPLTKFKKLDLSEILIDKSLQKELQSIVENCGDLSISRENVEWGVKIPFSKQTIYVWFEALLNYVFAIDYEPSLLNFLNFSKKWKNSLIICGKDNLKFQAYILPALLKSAGLNPPNKVLVHGMIVDENGIKMSKSLGNVIDPIEQIKKYGINAVRYYFLAGLNTFQDSSYSEEELKNKYNSDLANNFGNLVARITTIADEIIEINGLEYNNLYTDVINTSGKFIEYVDQETNKAHTELQTNFNIKNCFAIINNLVSYSNKYYTEQKPYDKESKNRKQVLLEMLYFIDKVSIFYMAATPEIENFCKSKIFNLQKIIKIILYKRIENLKVEFK